MKIRSHLKTIIYALIGCFAILGIALYGSLFTSTVHQPGGVVYNLRQGTSTKTFITETASQHIIRHPWIYEVYISFFPRGQLKAGEYLFPQGSSPASIWRQVITGKGVLYHTFTIVPGWTFTQLKEALAQTADLKHTILSMTDEQIMQQLGLPNTAPEGEFFPETYFYLKDADDMFVLKRAFHLMQKKLSVAWQARDTDSIFKTSYEALTAASIVEKEAYLESERPIIAGVLVNRLKSDMLLQFDPTVIYGMGDRYQGKIYKSDLLDDTPYNTYIHKGLPPTPIAMPSLSAINAVLHPQQHHYLYFVARGDGSHQFSETLSEHHVAVDAAALNKEKEMEKTSPQSYANPMAGERYLQHILTVNMTAV